MRSAKGSLVDENKLRFDFSHPDPLTDEQIKAVEEIVNREALNNIDVTTTLMKLDDAQHPEQKLFLVRNMMMR